MPSLPPEACLARVRNLYRDAFKCPPETDAIAVKWAHKPELWATHQIAHHGWSYMAAEAVVRQCRILVRRAAQAAEVQL